MIILFDKVCVYNPERDEIKIYGQYIRKFDKVILDIPNKYEVIFYDDRPDFYIRISGKPLVIPEIVFHFNICDRNTDPRFLIPNGNVSPLPPYFMDDINIVLSNINLKYPFDNSNIKLDRNRSAILSTMCKNYSHRLDEWIRYNLKLGFSEIVIFDNEVGTTGVLHEPSEHCMNELSIRDVCKKYSDNVLVIDYPYSAFPGAHYDNVQRIALHIVFDAFKSQSRNIAFIDADEFIYIPNMARMNIEAFLDKYTITLKIQSNVLTNKGNSDIIDNNILQISEFVGENMYTKLILYNKEINDGEFFVNPHIHPKSHIVPKSHIIHYHCWINNRYDYKENMQRITFLKEFYNSQPARSRPMRFVQVGHSHRLNEEAFIRGCIIFGIEYEKFDTISEISGQPDLIWATGFWIDPSLFPTTKFMFGPQFFVFPTKDGPLAIYNKESVADRCLYNCLSEWNLRIHNAFLSKPVVPYACLPFGIDTESMKPNPRVQKKEHILIYWKLRDSANMQHVVDVLINNNLNFKVVKYGFYKSEEYHKLLLESKLCIWLGRHESQGFAFQEALSFNVPLLVYDVLDMKEEVNDHNISEYVSYNRISLPATAAAFWDPICGEKTTNPKDIDPLLKKMMAGLDKYRPREFVERELSDKVCFKRMLDRFGFYS